MDWTLVLLALAAWPLRISSALLFRSDQFRELTPDCHSADGKPLTFILSEENPALYLSVDPYVRLKAAAATSANAGNAGGGAGRRYVRMKYSKGLSGYVM